MNYKNIDPEQFKELMESGGAVVLDVRSEIEATQGVISDSILIDFFDPSFRSEVDKLDKSKTYLIYCRSGNRSGSACGLMDSMGFKNLFNLSGGIIAWTRKSVAA